MRIRKYAGQRRGERGQTIALIAVSIVSLLAMAALAIDVVSLYTAKSEIQRAADAAALAAAKAIADSGVTSLQSSDGNFSDAQKTAANMATAAINAVLSANSVAGQTPTWLNQPLDQGFATNPHWGSAGYGNAIITVSLQQTGLPTFFARVLGQRGATTGASATAEAYNPANLQNFTPILTRCVKPWLVGNKDPNTGNKFVTPSTGAVEDAIGQTFDLISDCNVGSGFSNCPALSTDPPSIKLGALSYVAAATTANTGDVCPSSTASPCGAGDNPTYKSAIECCNITPYSCGGNTFTNMGSSTAAWDPTVNPNYHGGAGDTAEGTECLIHATNPGPPVTGQDSLNMQFPTGPPLITAGSASPMSGSLVSTSNSVVTIPIIDSTGPSVFKDTFPYSVTVIGFLQAFINNVDSTNTPNINITVLNVIGCSQTETGGNPGNGNAPVVGGVGSSPIPVRLITPP